MKVITEPSVEIVSAPRFFPHPIYELPDSDIEAENIIAIAGKVCYDSYGKDGRSVDAHVTSLVESGHHSVLEACPCRPLHRRDLARLLARDR